MAVLVLLAVTAVVGLFYYHWQKTRSRLYRAVEKYFSGPRTVPFLGNAWEFPPNSFGITQLLLQYSKQYDRFFRLWLGPDPFVLLYDPKDVETLLSSTTAITKSDVYRFTLPWIGTGLLTSTGAKWKSRRRILTPTFHFEILKDFVDTFESNGQILIEKLKEKVKKPTFDIYPFANLYALDNICETAMGAPINAQKDSNSTYVKAVKAMCSVVNFRAFQPWLAPELLFSLSKYSTTQKQALSVLHTHSKNTIRTRRQEIIQRKTQAGNKTTAEDDGLNRKKKLAFLDLLLESAEGSALSDEDIHEEVETFMFEGHDTITSGISFTLYLLSQHPEIQEKVYQEQKELFGNSNRPATHKDYQDMKYLERVLKEAQRIYPSVPVIGRQIEEDLPLHDGVVLPQGCQAMVFMPALHMDPRVWPEPEKFDPDRFLVENTATRSPYASVPFSAGSRNCIGQKFATMELKASVGKVVRNFKLLPCNEDEKPHLAAELVFISNNGINLRLDART